MKQQDYSDHSADALVRLSLFVAIVTLQSWVPFLGNIYTPVLSITIIQITVILATLWLGRRSGLVVGTVWGINSWIRSFVVPTPLQQLVFVSPLVSVLPRILMPLVLFPCIRWLEKRPSLSRNTLAIISGVLGSVLNTVFVLGAMALFRRSNIEAFALDLSFVSMWGLFISIMTVNAIPEVIASAIIVPLLDRVIGSRFV